MFCPECGEVIQRQTPQEIVDQILAMEQGLKFQVLAPVVRTRKGEFVDLFEDLASQGYSRVMVDGEVHQLSNPPKLEKQVKHDIDVVMDVCQAMAAKFLSAMGQIRISQQKPAEWKICRLLQIFMEHYGVAYDGKILITEKVSQQMIADMLGMNRITVAKKFKELRDISMLEQINGFLCIRSSESLQKHMDLMK